MDQLRLTPFTSSDPDLQSFFAINARSEQMPAAKKNSEENTNTGTDWTFSTPVLWNGTVDSFLAAAPKGELFDLIVTSPPYNIGKEYEKKQTLAAYFLAQRRTIAKLVEKLKPTGSICWQVGSNVRNGELMPLDLEFHKIFRKLGLKLRNRIIWHFGHGLHGKRRFSGRYEVVLWYTKSDNYYFNLDAVRIQSKYPGKVAYKGKRKGQYSSHPDGKNPEDVWLLPPDDVWSIPNVKANHIEKTQHPCQFPVGLAERLILALTKKRGVVFDPYCGVASAGVAALHHQRRFVGCEKEKKYSTIGHQRLERASRQEEPFRPHNKPIYDHTKSILSVRTKLRVRKKSSSEKG
jgi:adenine-specific DNA-methyltransferase